MTAHEAINAIKIKEMQIECKATRMCEFCEGLAMAEEALEKQIPKKPIKHMANPFGFPYYECPVCGYFDVSGQKYCHECGQKLDWGEQNE